MFTKKSLGYAYLHFAFSVVGVDEDEEFVGERIGVGACNLSTY